MGWGAPDYKCWMHECGLGHREGRRWIAVFLLASGRPQVSGRPQPAEPHLASRFRSWGGSPGSPPPQDRGLLPSHRGQQGPPLRILGPEASPYPRLRGTGSHHHMELLVIHWTGAHRNNLPATLTSLAHPRGCGLGSNEQARSLHVIGGPPEDVATPRKTQGYGVWVEGLPSFQQANAPVSGLLCSWLRNAGIMQPVMGWVVSSMVLMKTLQCPCGQGWWPRVRHGHHPRGIHKRIHRGRSCSLQGLPPLPPPPPPTFRGELAVRTEFMPWKPCPG